MLSNRLKSLVKNIESTDKIIDIGCDHALLDIYLVKEGIINNLIISDIHQGSLSSGIKNIQRNKLSNQIDARLGDGLNVLNENDDIDTILISGMGTNTIINILNHSYLKHINKLIIQSNNDHFLLRKEIIKMGFYIADEEYLIDQKKNYINIVFKRGKRKYRNKQIKYGPYLLNDQNYLNFELSNCYKILNLIPDNHKISKIKLNKEIMFLKKQLKKILR